MKRYPIYKGLQKPLSFKGLKGKYIAWGVLSLVCGLLIGGLLSALINIYLGGVACIILTAGFLAFTLLRQKGGLHSKSRERSLMIYPNKLKIRYEKEQDL